MMKTVLMEQEVDTNIDISENDINQLYLASVYVIVCTKLVDMIIIQSPF